MKTASILPQAPSGDGAHPDTRELLARSQSLQIELAQTNNRLRSLEEQLNSSEQLASFGHFKIDAQERYALSRSASHSSFRLARVTPRTTAVRPLSPATNKISAK